MKSTTIYTDGSCKGNPGPGGWAAIIRTEGQEERVIKGGVKNTTSVRMELLAVLNALTNTKSKNNAVTIRTDSQNVANGYNSGSAKEGLRKGRKKNADLWKALLDRAAYFPSVRIEWVKGHSGDPDNERCDKLAKEQARGKPKATDAGYERELARKERAKTEQAGKNERKGKGPVAPTATEVRRPGPGTAAILLKALAAGCEAFLACLREQEGMKE